MNRIHRWLGLGSLILISALFGGLAAAQEEFEAQELGACAIDIATYCSKVRKGGGRVVKCLQENRPVLADDCKAAVTPSDFSNPDEGVSIAVTIDDIDSKKGVIVLTLSDDPATFPRGRRTIITPITGTSVVATFKHLKPGSYAVTAFHDENENGQFDLGAEGFVATNATLSAPDFVTSAVKVVSDTKLAMSMYYF